MRGAVAGLATPHPLGETLPALFHGDEFAQAFTAALDEVLAPVFLALDCLDAYLDPDIAPPDFLDWLASWVGVELDETRPIEEQREMLKRSVGLFAWRGTKRGLSEAIELYTGTVPEIIDSGGVSFSEGPDGPLPGSAVPSLVVRVRLDGVREVSEARLNEIIRSAKPAHLPHTVELIPAQAAS